MYSLNSTAEAVGFPIRTSPDQRLLGISPKHFAAYHVLHRLLVPRHSPCALSSLLFRRRLSTWQNQNDFSLCSFKKIVINLENPFLYSNQTNIFIQLSKSTLKKIPAFAGALSKLNSDSYY